MIELKIENHIAVVTLNHPPVNALSDTMTERLHGVLDDVEAAGDVSVLLLRSALRVFCAGADLSLMRELLSTPRGCDQMIEIVRNVQNFYERLEEAPFVTVAELAGAALGGGLEMALSCDLRVAANEAKLGLPEAGLGLLPAAGGTQRLPRITGEAVARRLILGAEVIDGREAERLGVVHWSVPRDELNAWTAQLLQRLSALPAAALAANKRCIAATLESATDGYELELTETRKLHDDAETRRRIQAFLEKSR
jgi:enoyl-CoA hydratase/carnithine racemase